MQSAVLITLFEKYKKKSHILIFASKASYVFLKVDPIKRRKNTLSVVSVVFLGQFLPLFIGLQPRFARNVNETILLIFKHLERPFRLLFVSLFRESFKTL